MLENLQFESKESSAYAPDKPDVYMSGSDLGGVMSAHKSKGKSKDKTMS